SLGLSAAPFNFQQPITRLANSTDTTQLIVNSLGNVGIGTATPRNQLEIVGANNTLGLGDIGCGAGMGAVGPMGCNNYQFLGQGNGSPFINSSGLGSIFFRHNNVEANQMIIRPSGEVGIGTNNPQAKFHVAGNGAIIDLSPFGGGQLVIGNNPDDNRIYLEG